MNVIFKEPLPKFKTFQDLKNGDVFKYKGGSGLCIKISPLTYFWLINNTICPITIASQEVTLFDHELIVKVSDQ